MLQTIVCMDKMAALHHIFLKQGMMFGTMLSYMAGIIGAENNGAETCREDGMEDEDDEGPEPGNLTQGALSDVRLTAMARMCSFDVVVDSMLIFVL